MSRSNLNVICINDIGLGIQSTQIKQWPRKNATKLYSNKPNCIKNVYTKSKLAP